MSTLRDGASAPVSPFPLLPLRTGTLFPGTQVTLPIGRERSVALARTLRKGDVIGVASQKDPSVADPGEGELHALGTFARVNEVIRLQGGDFRLTLEGLARFTISTLVRRDPFWISEGTLAEESSGDSEEARLFARALHDQVREINRGNQGVGDIDEAEADPGLFADKVAATLGLPADKEMRVLAELDVASACALSRASSARRRPSPT
jgi:ATP-dependent Lon protease